MIWYDMTARDDNYILNRFEIFLFDRFYGPVPMGLLRGKVCYKVHALPPSLEPVVSSTVMLYRSGPQYSAIFSNRKTFAVTKEVVQNLVSDSVDNVDSEKSSKKIEEKSSS